MVKRYYVGNDGLVQHHTGTWVSLTDYHALQAALREALDSWDESDPRYGTETQLDRITELRKQFLED